MAVKLGTIVTDSITGFQGTAIARGTFANKCVRILVQPHAKEGETSTVPESHWFDEKRLKENDSEESFDSRFVGKPGTCKVTGYTGTIVAYTEYIHAMSRVEIQAYGLTKDGGVKTSIAVDVGDLKEYDQYKSKVGAETGGPQPRMTRNPSVTR